MIEIFKTGGPDLLFLLVLVCIFLGLVTSIIKFIPWRMMADRFNEGRRKEQQRALTEQAQRALRQATISVNEAREQLELPPLPSDEHMGFRYYSPDFLSPMAPEQNPFLLQRNKEEPEPKPEPPPSEPALLDQERKRKIRLR